MTGPVLLLRQDIRRLSLPGPVDLITLPQSDGQLSDGDDDLACAFRAIARNLRRGGTFLFDFIGADGGGADCRSGDCSRNHSPARSHGRFRRHRRSGAWPLGRPHPRRVRARIGRRHPGDASAAVVSRIDDPAPAGRQRISRARHAARRPGQSGRVALRRRAPAMSTAMKAERAHDELEGGSASSPRSSLPNAPTRASAFRSAIIPSSPSRKPYGPSGIIAATTARSSAWWAMCGSRACATF